MMPAPMLQSPSEVAVPGVFVVTQVCGGGVAGDGGGGGGEGGGGGGGGEGRGGGGGGGEGGEHPPHTALYAVFVLAVWSARSCSYQTRVPLDPIQIWHPPIRLSVPSDVMKLYSVSPSTP